MMCVGGINADKKIEKTVTTYKFSVGCLPSMKIF